MKQNDKQIPVILIVDDVEVNARLLKLQRKPMKMRHRQQQAIS